MGRGWHGAQERQEERLMNSHSVLITCKAFN